VLSYSGIKVSQTGAGQEHSIAKRSPDIREWQPVVCQMERTGNNTPFSAPATDVIPLDASEKRRLRLFPVHPN
jgi:hypothetical protein